jgi:glucosamine--fructose-6-phosphate aminotransferase (isomerizing)
MCGIFGYIGKKNSVQTVIQGLKKLEYRGYDSAGIAGIKEGKLFYCKEVGKVSTLEKAISEAHLDLNLDVAIAQTRWATHGVPNQVNAHPHFDAKHTVAVVHNGIIENHEALRNLLKEKGVKFISDTDTEVIAHLVADFYDHDILKAVQQAVQLLRGTYAFALVHHDFPDRMVVASYESPLVIGVGEEESFVSSDANAFAAYTQEALFLAKGEVAVVKADHVEIYDASLAQINKQSQLLAQHAEDITKGEFEHYTLKEIYEQPQTIRNALLSRVLEEFGTAYFEELHFSMNELLSVERILILACGTSWHAGLVAAYLLEDQARLPVQVEISSEFRYKNPVIPPRTLTIAISQSGETADTIAAVRELKAKGSKILAFCNVYGSTLAREADACIFLRAGPEVGVCSTKAFISQLVALSLFSLLMARMRNLSKQEGQEFLHHLKALPDLVQQVLNQADHIQATAKKYAGYQNFFFIGRNYMYPTSLEGALKLKEISYINANGYPAGEMKHGPIALINEDCPTVALCANKMTYDKMLSNLMEVKARNGKVIAIAEEQSRGLEGVADDILYIPETIDELASILTTVVTQLWAYYIAKERGNDIDQPRNLAKSVTVE